MEITQLCSFILFICVFNNKFSSTLHPRSTRCEVLVTCEVGSLILQVRQRVRQLNKLLANNESALIPKIEFISSGSLACILIIKPDLTLKLNELLKGLK